MTRTQGFAMVLAAVFFGLPAFGQTPPPLQTRESDVVVKDARFHSEVLAILLHHDVGSHFARTEDAVLALIDREILCDPACETS